jgi:hypothetical protein
MSPRKHVDAVDLVEREPIDGSAEVALIYAGRARSTEALSGKRDPARRGERKPLRQDPLTRP